MKKATAFYSDRTRYHYDFGECLYSQNWAQVDTREDAPWFGIWANPVTLEVVSYCEGDETRLRCESVVEFVATLRDIASRETFRGIDTMCSDVMESAFDAMGLSDLFHENRRHTSAA